MALGMLAGGGYAEPGSTTAQFLLVPVGGRPNALGGAYTGMADDAYAMHYNVGGLGMAKHELAFAHSEYVLDLTQEYLSYVHPLNTGAIAVSMNYFDYGKFDRTVITTPATPNTTTSFATQGSFDAANLAFSLGYGRQLFVDGLHLGVSLKYLRQQIDNFDDHTAAADMGAYWRTKESKLSVGFSVTNIGDQLRMKGANDRLPTTFRLGGAYRFIPEKLLLTADVEKTVRDDDYFFHVGGEYWVARMLALRAGWSNVDEAGSGFTAGAGVKVDRFTVDYSWADYDELDMAHRISLQYGF